MPRVAESPGLVDLIDDQIAALEQHGIAPAAAERHAKRRDDAQSTDVARIYGVYRERLTTASLADSASMISDATAALAASPRLFAGLRTVVVDGFSDFTTVQHELLKQLAARTMHMLITLPGDEGDQADRRDRPHLFFSPLRAAGLFRQSLRATIQHAGHSHDAWPALAHLQRNLFRNYRDLEAPSASALASLSNMHIVAASGVQAESVEIARRVKRLLVAGASPDDIVVAFRSMREHAERIRHTFQDYGIPFTLDSSRSLAASPVLRSLQQLLSLVAGDWPYRRVLQVASDYGLSLFVGDGEQDPRQAIETCVRYAQLPSGRRALLEQLDHWAGDRERTSEPTPARAAIARAALADLEAALDLLPRTAKLGAWITALGPLADRVGLLRPATAETASNWAILIRHLRTIEQIDAWTNAKGDPAAFTAAQFLEVFNSAVLTAPAAEERFEAGVVRVLHADAARFTTPKHLFVAGLSEQAFSATRRTETAPPPTPTTRPVSGPTKCCCSISSSRGPPPPSPLAIPPSTSVPKRCRPARYSSNWSVPLARPPCPAPISRSPTVRWPTTAMPRSQDRSSAVRPLLVRSTVAAICWHRWPTPAKRTLSRQPPRRLRDAGRSIVDALESVGRRAHREFSAFEGLVDSPAAAASMRSAFGPNHMWSPSRLETYAECPFLFFGQHVLHLEPTPELALASDVRRRGSVLHRALAMLYAQLRGAPIDLANLASDLPRQFHEVLSAVAQSRPGRGVDAAIREIERRQIAAWAEDLAMQDADYRTAWKAFDEPLEPTYFEARFGPGSRRSDSPGDAELSTDEPFTLATLVDGATEHVQFTGQIDRIDVGRVGDSLVFNVIDYKTSARAAVKDEEMLAGRQIQLPLYAMAVEELLLAGQNAVPLTAGYWSVLGRGYALGARTGGPLKIHDYRDGSLSASPDWIATREAIVSKIGELIANIRSGRFPVHNENAHCTDHCEFRTICRIAHVRSLEKTWPPQ